MLFQTLLLLLAPMASSIAHPTSQTPAAAPENYTSSSTPNVVPAIYDGLCFYPVPDPKFDLKAYLGTWYQVAGYPFLPTLGAKCVEADYSLNPDSTVKVVNTARLGPIPRAIIGSATPADPAYAASGAFVVSFPGTPGGLCKGPNYIVQEYTPSYAIVQTQRWDTLYILSRTRQPGDALIDSWIARAVALGSNATLIEKNDQAGCE